MPKFDFYPSFNAGEVSPLIDARTSLEKYRSACRTLENFQILPYGGVIRRPGTQYIGTAKLNHETRLIGFNFSTTTRYMIEMGVGYMRFWKPDGTPVYSSGTTPLEVATPYTSSSLREIQYVQINDIMYFAHEDHAPRKLSRVSETNWTFTEVKWDYPPLLDMNGDENLGLQFDGNFGNRTAYSVDKNLQPIANFFSPDHQGSQWAVQWKRNVNNLEFTIGGANWASNVLDLQGSYTVTTLGRWIGKIVLYRIPSDKLNVNGPEDTAIQINRSGTVATVQHLNHGYQTGDLVYISTAVAAAPLGDITLRKITKVDNNTYTYTVANSGATFAGMVAVENVSKMEKVKIFDSAGVERNFLFTGNEPDRAGLKLHIEAFTSATDAKVVIEANESNSGGTFTIEAVENTEIGGVITNGVQALIKVNNWLGMEWFRMDGANLQYVRTTQFSEAAFSKKRGYPRAVAFHESRLCFGGTAAQPNTIWCSAIDDFENFKTGTTASDAVQFTLAASEGNRIAWMYSQSQLLIGTTGDEWTIGSADTAQSLSATSVEARRQSSYGSKYMRAALVNDVLLFVQRNGRKVRELVYELNKDGWVAPDLTLLAEHITDGEIVELAYQQQPDAILWCVRGDGALIAMTYERDQKVVGWHRHLIAGGTVESVATIYGNATEDEVWLVVRRGNLRTIERFPLLWREHFDNATVNSYRFLDGHVSFASGSGGRSVGGLSHLNGRTVTIVQGSAVATGVVSGGAVSVPASSAGYVGMPYTSTLTPMKLDADFDDGTAQGRKKRIHGVIVRTLKSRDGEVQTNGGTWYDLANTTTTGDQKVILAGAFALDADVSLRQSAPWPMCVLAITPKWDAYGNE